MSAGGLAHRAARALGWLAGGAGLFAAIGVAVVPVGQRGLRSGLGAPIDLEPGLHLVLRPLQSVALRDATVRLAMGLATREDDADARPGAGPPLRATTSDGVAVELALLVEVAIEDARADADDRVRTAIAQAVHALPLATLEGDATGAASGALSRDTDARLVDQGLRMRSLQLVGVTLAPAQAAERDAAVVARLAARHRTERAALDLRQAEVVQAESAAARATEDTERALAAESAAEDQAARLAQVERVGALRAELDLAHAAVDARVLILEAEAGRIRDRARAVGQRRLSAALQGPGFEAYLAWVGQGFDLPESIGCPPPPPSPPPPALPPPAPDPQPEE